MSAMKTFLYMTLMTVLLVVIGGAFDLAFGGRGLFMAVFFLFSIGMNFFTYWFADTIVLKMHRAREVTPAEAPELHRIVDRLVERSGLPKPKVCVVPGAIPNAFATGRNPSHSAVAVTDGLMDLLEPDELEGVVAHELAHIKHYDMLLGTVMASMAGLIAMMASWAQWGLIFGGGRSRGGHPLAAIGGILMILIAPFFAMMIRGLISHQREFAADAGGARMSGNPAALAGALRKIERGARHAVEHDARMGNEGAEHMYFINHFRFGRRRMRMFSTHPPTEERIERLLAMHAAARGA